MVTIRVIRNLEEFGKLEAIWNPLLKRSMSDNLFLTWEWVSTWVTVYLKGPELFVMVVYSDDEPVAIAPLWLDHVRFAGVLKARTLKFLASGEVCSDYMDIIVQKKNHAEWIKALWNELFGPQKKQWDVFEYTDAPVQSRTLDQVYELADEDDRCLHREIVDYTVCPFMPLAETWEEFLAGLTGTRRAAVTGSRRRLEEQHPLSFEAPSTREAVLHDLNKLGELNTQTWQSRGQRGSFSTSSFIRFHAAVSVRMLAAHTLAMHSMYQGDLYLGSFYGFIYGDRLSYYVMSVVPSKLQRVNTGDVLLAHAMEHGIALGCREFDFLRGSEVYKYRWTSKDRRNMSLRLFNRTASSVGRSISALAMRAAKTAAKGLIGPRSGEVQ